MKRLGYKKIKRKLKGTKLLSVEGTGIVQMTGIWKTKEEEMNRIDKDSKVSSRRQEL